MPGDRSVVEPQREEAVELYRAGTRRLSEGKYAEAAALFERSLALLRGRGTLLNLAICHENLGYLATAFAEFREVLEDAERAGDSARAAAAREHLDWLEPQLAFVSLTLPQPAIPELQIEVDGVRVGIREDAPQPVAPGRRLLRAFAPGRVDWSQELLVNRPAERHEVVIPPLQRLPRTEQSVTEGPPEPRIRHRMPSPAGVARKQGPDWSVVYISGAATSLMASGALVSSILYYQRREAYYDATSGAEQVSQAEEGARRASAKRMDWINRAFVAGTAVGAGLTGYFIYRAVAPKKAAQSAPGRLSPWLARNGAGLEGSIRF